MKICRYIEDWNDAYANRAHVTNADEILAEFERDAPDFRREMEKSEACVSLDLSYGSQERERFDLFEPAGETKGLFVFVHGGYWMAFDKNSWSHLARQALAHGFTVAIPTYTLCPQHRIAQITEQIGRAIEVVAQKVSGPIVLAGHSAGGHLVSRMGCKNAPLNSSTVSRIKMIISISGVHDLRPMMQLDLNETLCVDREEAQLESPALLEPRRGITIACVGGSAERPEFIRQNSLLANVWTGLGVKTIEIFVDGKNHFDIIQELNHGRDGWLSSLIGSVQVS